MANKKPPTKRKKDKSILVPALSVVALVILAIFDIKQEADFPSYIYIGLLGSILGATWEDIQTFFGGRK